MDTNKPVNNDTSLALRPKQAALALGISKRLLWSLTNRGEIPHTKLGRCILYPVVDLQQWLSKRTKSAS